jgi:hypothetical protein
MGVNMKRSSIDVITGEITEDEIPQEEIDKAVEANKIAFDALSYGEKRASEYPPIADQQDMQFHDAIDGTTTWQDAIQAVKDKYPKPE